MDTGGRTAGEVAEDGQEEVDEQVSTTAGDDESAGGGDCESGLDARHERRGDGRYSQTMVRMTVQKVAQKPMVADGGMW